MIVWKCFMNFERTLEKFNQFWKEKNVSVNKGRIKITLRWKSILYLWKKNLKRKYKSKSINYRKVRDHCHYAGKYRGTAHSIWNLKFNLSNEILVVLYGFALIYWRNPITVQSMIIIRIIKRISEHVWGKTWIS